MHTTLAQDRLVDYAAHHYVHAEPRDEGDVAVFTELSQSNPRFNPTMCEIDVVKSREELRAVLGY